MRGICGAWGLLGLVATGFLLANACSAKNVVVDQSVQVYVPAACGDAANASATYTGLGDFQPTSDPAEVVNLSSTGFVLAQPPNTRELVLSPITDAGPWAGAALVPDAGNLELLALPQNRACSFTLPTNLAGNAGATIGMIDSTHALLIGGTTAPYVVDLGTGAVTHAPAAPSPRDYGSVSPMPDGALIAGGENPALNGGEVQATAYIYTPGTASSPGTYGEPVVLLGGLREQHAAATLPDGSVILVGGVTARTSGASFVTGIDVLTPGQPEALAGPTLIVRRRNPTVLVLPTGQVFIGGGIGTDGLPVTTVEWLSVSYPRDQPLVFKSLGTATLCGAGTEQGFALTEEGAVLAVMGPGVGTPTCSNVHLVRPPSATAAAIVEDAPALVPAPSHVRIFQGPSASPVLVTDTAVLRWNPWTAKFSQLADNAGGVSSSRATSLAPSPGLALWLGQDAHVWALRFDTRGAYATDFAHPTYLQTDDLFTAPDRRSGADVGFSPADGGRLTNAASIFLTDATFLDVTTSVKVLGGGTVSFVFRAATGATLGAEVVCTASGVPDGGTVTAIRSGASVTVSAGAGSPLACPGTIDPTVRVAVGLRAPAGATSVVRSLTATR